MPLYPVSMSPGLDVRLNYSSRSGRVSRVELTNDTAAPVHVTALLAGGQVYGGNLDPGSTTIALPNGTVTVSFDAAGEPSFGGREDERSFSIDVQNR